MIEMVHGHDADAIPRPRAEHANAHHAAHPREGSDAGVRPCGRDRALPPDALQPIAPAPMAAGPADGEGELICPERIPRRKCSASRSGWGRRAPPHSSTSSGAAGRQRVPAGVVPVLDQSSPKTSGWALSVDCTFKNTSDSDFVVIQVWCTSGPNHYLVDQRRERMGFNATVKAIRAMCEKYPRVVRKLIEDKANGARSSKR